MIGGIDILVIFGIDSHLLKDGLLTGNHHIALTGEGRQKHPVRGLSIVIEFVLLTGLVGNLHNGTAMGHTGGDAHQDRQMQLL